MGDPCLFRRLEGPGIRHPYPEHTGTEDWRKMAPNQRFEGHHVEQLSPSFKYCLPTPNVLEKKERTGKREWWRALFFDRVVICGWHFVGIK